MSIDDQALYQLGCETEAIRQKIQRLKEKLDSAYPDGVIFRLHNDHKKWGDKKKIAHMIQYKKGRCTEYVTKRTNYVVLGGAETNWDTRHRFTRVREWIEQGSDLQLIREEDLTASLGEDLWE